MKGLATALYFIGYGGNALLFLYIEAVGIMSNPLQLINPLFHIGVIIQMFVTPLFWLFLLITLAAFGLMHIQENSTSEGE